MNNEWEIIVAWIKEQGVPEDSEVILVKPIQIGDKPDERLWIDVLSEEWGIEHSDGSHPGDPDGYYDPAVRQYQLIETDTFYRMKLLIKNTQATIAKQRELLEKMEWCDVDQGHRYEASCPLCGGWKKFGHDADCELAKVLNDS